MRFRILRPVSGIRGAQVGSSARNASRMLYPKDDDESDGSHVRDIMQNSNKKLLI